MEPKGKSKYVGNIQWVDGRILINSGASRRGAHRLDKFRFCPQLFSYEDVLGITIPEDKTALVNGSGTHIGAAHHYVRRGAAQPGGVVYMGQTFTDPDAFHEPIPAMRLAAGLTTGVERTLWEKLGPNMVAMLEHYVIWCHGQDLGYRVVAVEQEVEVMVEGNLYTQRIDLALEDRRGQVCIFDHKTSGRPDKAETYYEDDWQIAGLYRFGRGIYKDKFDSVRLNIIGSVAPFVCRRVTAAFRPVFARRLERRVLDVETEIKRLLDSGRDPWDWPIREICRNRFGHRCKAWRLCHEAGRRP